MRGADTAVIVASAGHVDHGKTTLVHALTGTDTDRLAEEKRRGMSIEPGFAYRALPAGGVLGFVDVPGHQRFVHNMLACIAGVDLGLLVVAADDGPMPQTREHLDILVLLGVPALMVALTRIDRVGTERRLAAAAEVRTLLADGPYRDAPLYPVAAPSGEGLAALDAALVARAGACPAHASRGHFRLAVDRAFTLRGIGVIATGTVFAGRVAAADHLRLMPGGREVRVRGLHADDQPAECAVRGQRAALNLTGAGLEAGDLTRGDWLVAAPLAHAGERLDARLRLLPSVPRSLRHWSEVHLHLGAAHRHARVAVLGAGAIEAGGEALVQLVLDRPLHALRGDRLVVRDQSARRTLGGGVVLDPCAPRRGRARPARLAWLRALAIEDLPAAFAAALHAAPGGVGLASFARLANLDDAARDELLRTVLHHHVETADGGLAIADEHWRAIRQALLAAVAHWHRREPQRLGPDVEALARGDGGQEPGADDGRLLHGLSRELLHAAAGTLVAEGRLARHGLMLHLPDHRPRLEAAQLADWQRVAAALLPARGSAPTLHQLALALRMPLEHLRALLRQAVSVGLAVAVSRNRYLPLVAVARLAAQVETLAARKAGAGFSVAEFRDASAIGRNLAVDLLEYYDRVGFTRRVGDRRHLAARAARLFGAGQA